MYIKYFQCPKCDCNLTKKRIDSQVWFPYCSACDSMWIIELFSSDLRIEYKEQTKKEGN